MTLRLSNRRVFAWDRLFSKCFSDVALQMLELIWVDAKLFMSTCQSCVCRTDSWVLVEGSWPWLRGPQAVARAKGVYEGKTLLPVVFETLFQYLSYLRAIATKLNKFGSQVAFYMAAAVSDFYIPWSCMVWWSSALPCTPCAMPCNFYCLIAGAVMQIQMSQARISLWGILQVEHKMQSSEVGSQLHLTLEKTPKMLGCLRHEWAPSCFIVSFKLETDDTILVHKVSILSQSQHCICLMFDLCHQCVTWVSTLHPDRVDIKAGQLCANCVI